jgi:hypothetical protein
MLSLLFDCSAFEISATVQAVNDVLFPVVLFVIIFWLMCEIFLVDANNSLEINKTQTNKPNVDNSFMGIKTEKTAIELLNVDIKHQHLKVCR